MERKKVFAFVFGGVITAGVLVLGVALLLRFLITDNAIVTVITFFAIFAGAFMAGVGLISLLITLLALTFSKGNKNKSKDNDDTVNTQEN